MCIVAICSQGGKSPRPPSTVESLLHLNGLQQFSSILMVNGYDDMDFLAEVSEEELKEIGVTESLDRLKVRMPSCLNCYH